MGDDGVIYYGDDYDHYDYNSTDMVNTADIRYCEDNDDFIWMTRDASFTKIYVNIT
jgi:hypothetical protein